MIKITAIIIAKDEENLIGDCLESVKFCDEIIVVDNNSKDKTVEISKKSGATVYSTKTDKFSSMRNLGFSKAKGEWVLYIDADERISPELALEIKSVINKNRDLSAYRLRRKNFYYGNHEWPYVEHLERLFKKKDLKEWKGDLHESPVFEGKLGELKNFLVHYSHRNLSQMVRKTIEWSEKEAQLRYDAGHPKMTWWRFPRVMLSAFFDSYFRQEGWKAGTIGIIESMYQAFSMFVTYAKLWELQNQ